MRLAIATSLALLLGACSKPATTCTPTARNALLELYKAAANDAINTGACDGVQRIEDCPTYATLELHFTLVEKAMCEK